jgi:hypothetical protein
VIAASSRSSVMKAAARGPPPQMRGRIRRRWVMSLAPKQPTIFVRRARYAAKPARVRPLANNGRASGSGVGETGASTRRLSGITQIVRAGEADVFHTRQQHTIKVAQVGRRLAKNA